VFQFPEEPSVSGSCRFLKRELVGCVCVPSVIFRWSQLGSIIKPFDNQTKIWGWLSSPLIIKRFEIFDYQSSLSIISFTKRLLTNQTRQTKARVIRPDNHLLHTIPPTKLLPPLVTCVSWRCHHHRWGLLCRHKSVIWYWLMSSMFFPGSCPWFFSWEHHTVKGIQPDLRTVTGNTTEYTGMWPIPVDSLFNIVFQTCLLAFSQRFLRSYLSFHTYSRCVSRQGTTGPFHYPPPHLKRPHLRSTYQRVKRKKGGRREKKIF
jgi:hypothetical protein